MRRIESNTSGVCKSCNDRGCELWAAYSLCNVVATTFRELERVPTIAKIVAILTRANSARFLERFEVYRF